MAIVLEHPDDDRFYIENVEPLIASVEPRGQELEFFFRCPVSGFEVSYCLPPGLHLSEPDGSIGSRISKTLERSTREGKASSGSLSARTSLDWSVSEIEEAACDAFQAVSSDFIWDGMRWTYWEAEDLVAEFLELIDLLLSLPAPNQKILHRLLSALAFADDKPAQAASQLLAGLLGDDLAFSRSDLPSAEAMMGLGERQVISAALALGYAIACADGYLSEAEEKLLDLACVRSGIGALRQWELKRMAVSFVMDEAFTKAYDSGQARAGERAQAYALGSQLHLTRREIRDIEWRFLKRSGLA